MFKRGSIIILAKSFALTTLLFALHTNNHVHAFFQPMNIRSANSFAVTTSTFTFTSRTTTTAATVKVTEGGQIPFSLFQLKMSSENNNDASTRRRRKRKDGKNSPSISTSPDDDQSDDDAVVVAQQQQQQQQQQQEKTLIDRSKPAAQLKIRDVRDIVSGNNSQDQDIDEYDEEDEEDDDDEYEYYYEDENNNEIVVSGSQDSSLEALLADAKRMRQEAKDNGEEEEGVSIPKAMKSVVSTIITIDFFVVCALLAWFLSGIFCSYILKDDAVQIAFNGKFESVVQPALGVLMIGSAAGSVFNDSEKEE